MKAQTLIKQWLSSSPALRLVHVLLIVILGLGVFWWAMYVQPVKADPAFIYVRIDGHNSECNGETNAAYTTTIAPACAVQTIEQGVISVTVGGMVFVATGTYTENVTINKSLTLQGINTPDGPDAAIVAGRISVTSAETGATVRQLRIVPGNVTGNAAAVSVNASNVTISENLIDGITGDVIVTGTVKGIHLYSSGLPGITNITVTTNTIRNVANPGEKGADGIMVQGVITDVMLMANTIQTVTSAGWAYGIEIAPTASATTTPPADVTIQQNAISSVTAALHPGVGAIIDTAGTTPADASQVTIFGNTFFNLLVPLANKDITHTLNASGNYLGYTDTVILAQVISPTLVGRIDYTPWLANDTDTAPGTPGFQGDFSALWVGPHNEQTGAVGRIQEGVDLVTIGGTVNVAAGTYTDPVTITKSLTLQGAGVGQTILDGQNKSSGGGVGIQLSPGVDNVNIYNMTITHYATGIHRNANGDATENVVFEDLDVSDNYNAGIYFSGNAPARHIRYTRIIANDNNGATGIGRGIFMQSHAKENIVVEDGEFRNNRISGIDLNIGALDGVRIVSNTVSSSAEPYSTTDSGIGILGLINSGTYTNEISNNNVSVHGRFGIEIKGAQANGNTSGAGSFVVAGNTISHADPGAPLNTAAAAENRDLAGIAVGDINNSGEPNSVVLLNNTVSGFRQYSGNTTPDPDTSTGFCISVSGANYRVEGNEVDDCDVGIQEQQGFTGTQVTTGDEYFGRDNSTVACGTVSGNTFGTTYGGMINQRQVGDVGDGVVTNTDIGKGFCAIQAAVDDAETLSGHTLNIGAGTYRELITVPPTKSLTLDGAPGAMIQPGANITGFASAHDGAIIRIQAPNVVIRNLVIDGDNPEIDEGLAYGGADINALRGIYMNASAPDNLRVENVTLRNLGRGINLYGGQNHTLRDNVAYNLGGPDDGNYGYGILLHNNSSALISGNTISQTLVAGIFMQNNYSANHTDILTNTVQEARIGLGWNMLYGGGSGRVENNTVADVEMGMQITAITNGYLEVRDNTFTLPTGDDEIGFLVWGTRPQTVLITGNTVNGSDMGVLLEDVNATFGPSQAHVQLTNNTFDGSTTAIEVSSNSITNSVSLTATGNVISNTITGLNLTGTEAIDHVTFAGNTLDNATTAFNVSTMGDLYAYANNIISFTTGINDPAGELNARHNWWGTYSESTGVNVDSWNFRLGAPVAAWGMGTLDDAALTSAGGTGTGIIVNHADNAPFGRTPAPYVNTPCSDYYDFFVLNADEAWTVRVPLDATRDECNIVDLPLYHFALTTPGDWPDDTCSGDACWQAPLGVIRDGDILTVTVDAAALLQGTPFVASNGNANLVVSKTNSRTTVQPGETLAYLITLTNTGNLEATNIHITDTLPISTTFIAASDGGSLSAPGSVTWPPFNLPGGDASVTRLLVVSVDNPLLAGVTAITNTVAAIAPGQTTLTETQDVDAVSAAPDLALSKSNGAVTVAPGDTLVYTLTYTNLGNQGATGVVITETVPEHTAFTGPAGWTGSGTTYTYTVGSLLAGNGGSVTFTVAVTMPLEAGVTHIHNTATIADDGSNSPDVISRTATLATPVSAAPDLEISKSGSPDPVVPGAPLTYQIVVTNTGPQGATGVRITDYLPAHTTFAGASHGGDLSATGVVTWPTFALDGGGASVTRWLTVTVTAPFPADTNVITNTATVADDGANGPDPTPENNSTTLTTSVTAAPDLTLRKNSAVLTVTPGSTLIYRLVITNTGNQLAGGIVLTDTLPAHTAFTLASHDGAVDSGVVTWPPFDLPGGGVSTTRLLVVGVDNPLPADVTALTNTATLRDNRGFTATAQYTNPINANPEFILSKTSAVITTTPGAEFSYTLTLTNTGNQAATNVVISDTLPADVAFVGASDEGDETSPGSSLVVWPAFNLPSGASVTRVLTVSVNPTLPAGLEWLVNTATVVDDRGNTATTQHAVLVQATPDLVLTKSDGGVTTTPGATLAYTLTYTNTGAQGATGVVIAETVPAYTTFEAASSHPDWLCAGATCTYPVGDLPATITREVTFTVRVAYPLPATVANIVNTASIADDGLNGADPTPPNNTPTITTTVVAAPLLEISKSNAVDIVQPGDTLSYRITLTNTGNLEATNIHITDTLPLSTTFIAASDGGSLSAPGSVTWPPFNLPGGDASVTRLLVVSVDNPLLAGVTALTNTVAAIAPGQTLLTDTQDVDTVSAAPDLALSKSNGAVTVAPGDTLVYTLTYTNLGNQGATGVVITETLPTYTTFAGPAGWDCTGAPCTYAVGSLPAGATRSITFAVTLDPALPAGVTQLVNTAGITDDGSNGADTNPANNSASTVTPVSAAPDLVISKSGNVDPVAPGAPLTYQIIITNTGSQGATGVRITDYLPAHTTFGGASDGGGLSATGVVTWPTFTLPGGGASVTRWLTVTVANPFPADTNVITNTATVADDGANGPDPTPGNNSATLTTSVTAAPSLALHKSSDVLTVTPGSTLIYRLVITNTGNQLAGGIVLTDTLPAYTAFTLASHDGAVDSGIVTWPAFDLPGGGASATRLLVVGVDTPLPAGVTALTNTAALRDNRGFTATAQYTNPVNANPEFLLVKTSAVITTTPNAEFSYTLTLTNTGNQDATNVVISDTLPADVTFVSASDGGYTTTPGAVVWPALPLLPSGASVTRVLTVRVNTTLPAGLEWLVNTATVVDDRGNTATTQHAVLVTATPDLVLTKSDGGVNAIPGALLAYTLTYTNTGAQGATGVVIAETVPAYTTFEAASSHPDWLCAGATCTYPVGDLPATFTREVTFTVRVADPLPATVANIVNTAAITDDGLNGADPTPPNNTPTITTTVDAAPLLEISKSNAVDTVQPGDTLSYLITLTNTGNLEATGIRITDTLPLSTTFIAASDGGGLSAPGVVTWPPFNLPGGNASVIRLLVVSVDNPLLAGVTALTNTVAAIAPGQTTLTDTQDFDAVSAAPDLALSKSNGAVTVAPGDTLVYTLTYANLGNQGATGVVITETLPAYTTFNPAASSPGWDCTGAPCTYAVGSLPAGATRSITFAVTIDPTLAAGVTQIVNTAGIADDGSNGADTNPANNTASTVTPVSATPDLTLSKSDGGVTTTPGSTLVYTLTYENVGNQAATTVVITETVPAHTTFNAAGSSPGWSCANNAPAGTICTNAIGSLPAGSSDDRQFAVNVIYPALAGVTQIDNTASIADDGSNGADPTPVDNTASTTTPVQATPDLEISKSNGVNTVEPGDTLVYTLTVANTGLQGATGIRITDYLPAHTTFESASDGGGLSAPGIVTWPLFDLPGGGVSVTRTLTVTVVDPFPVDTNGITNTATVADDGANGPDPTPGNNTAEDVDPVSAAPVLALSKSNDVTTVTPGSTLIYRLVITNSGSQLAAGIVLTDTLPEHTAFVSASEGGQETSSGSGVVTWPAFDLPGRTSATRLLVVTVDNPLPAGVIAITNTAALHDNRDNTATAQDTDTVDANPLLVLEKTNAVDTTVPGATLVYTLTLTNNGNQAATGIRITDTLPADVTFVTASDGGYSAGPGIVAWPPFDLAGGGASVTRHLTVDVNATLPAGLELLINTAQASEDRGHTAFAQHADRVIATPDLEISKSNGVDTVVPGTTLTYQIVVTNSGPQGATGIRITDYLPAHTTFESASDGGGPSAPGIVTWPLFDLPGGGASVTRQLTVAIADPFPVDTNVITNTVTVADDGANGPDPTPENNSAEDVDAVFAAPSLQLSKSNDVTTVTPGSTLIYRLVITNSGSQLAAGIVLTDTLPGQTAFHLASDNGSESAPGIVVWPAFNLPGGASATRLLVVTVDNPLPAGVTALTNTAVLHDNRGYTADAQDIDVVDANPLLVLEKTNAVDTTVPDATLVYTLTLTNNGNQAATGIRITDTLPADVAFVAASDGGYSADPGVVVWPPFDLAGGGASVTRYLTVDVNATLPAGLELLINTAQASEDRGYTAMAQHADRVVAAPDLTITKSDGGVSPQPGEVLMYMLTYANVGEQDATGAVIVETVPAYTTFEAAASSPGWTCADGAPAGTLCEYSIDDLPANTSGNVDFAVRVVIPLPVSVTQTGNTASIADDGSNGADTDPTNNNISINTPIAAAIDLLITKNDGGVTAEPGETIVYTLTYTNNGDQIAGGVVITETVPALTTFDQTESSLGWACLHGAPAGTVCTYPLGDVIEAGMLLFAVDVVLPFPIEVSEITNQVVIGADANNIPDANPDNNVSATTTPIITRPDLIVGKDDGFSAVLPDQRLTYVITVTNVGTQNATNVQITDTLPDHVNFAGASDGGAQSGPGVVTWPVIPQLALDEIITRTLRVIVNNVLPAGVSHITNTVVVADDGTHGPDLNPNDNIATDVNIVGAMPDLALYKTVNRADIYPSGLLVYTIRVENTGSQGATGVSIVDTLPPYAQFVNASEGGYESTPGVVTWPAFTLNAGEQAVRTLTVRAATNLPEGLMLLNTASVSDDGANGEDPTPENNTDTASSVIRWPVVYLPLVLRGHAIGPDLIVENIVAANGDIAITIRNQGEFPVPAPLGFWVDLYINPSPAPTRVNQTWDPISPYGAAWGVDREALPILPGESRTLHLYDIYYKPNYSRLPAALRPGDIIYVQVDSFNAATTYGAVLEDHEMGGGEYNNIVRMVIDAYTPLNPMVMLHSVPEAAEAYSVPERP